MQIIPNFKMAGDNMSWDIFVQNIPMEYKKIEDIPKDFNPEKIYKLKDFEKAISSIFAGTDFSDPSWGIYEGDGYSIEFSLGSEEPKSGFAMHIRGNNTDAVTKIDTLLKMLKLRGIDAQTGEFFSPDEARESFREWQDFRDRAIERLL